MRYRAWGAVCLVTTLVACGGGGEPAPVPTTRPALPTLAQDIAPSGPRADHRSRNYFPAQAGDTWTYDRQPNGVSQGLTLTRSVSGSSGADVVLTETSQGESDSTRYRRTADGIVMVEPMAGATAVMNQAVGNVLEYAEPFYATGETRSVVRQGSTGEDLDGDGIHESFRLEMRQTFLGFESVTLPNGYRFEEVARFRNVVARTLQPSAFRLAVQVSTSTEETWWAPGAGLIRAERSAVDSTGAAVEPPYTLVLTGGTVAGASVFASTGRSVRVSLTHQALVYDATRNLYYASVPGSVPVNGNQIATIRPGDGAVSYAGRAVGSQPAAMAIHPGGAALYVALNGTGDVVKLRLPDFAEVWRVRLPTHWLYGQMLTQQLAASPTDPDVVAVSLDRPGVSPRHGGVVLIRNGILQPRQTDEHTGSNLITFGADGSELHGFNNDTTEFGLRRISVVADGLQQVQVVTASGDFGTRTLDWSPQGLVLDRTLYRPADLALLGRADVEGVCRAHRVPNRLVCARSSSFSTTNTSQLAVVDATSLVILRTITYGFALSGGIPSEIVPGPAGQVALRLDAIYASWPAEAVVLFNSPSLE